jgi:hypothetical protein
MEYFRQLYLRSDVDTKIEEFNHQAYRQMSQICMDECFDLTTENINPNEKNCFTNCQSKILGPGLQSYKRFFG